jgi:hypothetical protein
MPGDSNAKVIIQPSDDKKTSVSRFVFAILPLRTFPFFTFLL